jgi:hypothetical protein
MQIGKPIFVGPGALGCLALFLAAAACSGASPSPSPKSDAGAMPPDRHPVVGACDGLPKTGQWENITPKGVPNSGSLALDPFEAGTLWLGGTPDGAYGLGVFKSTDCGATWSHVNTGTNGAEIDRAHIWSLAVDYVNRGTIYVIGQYGPQGIWKSINGGVDWVQLLPPGGAVANVVPAGPSNPSLAAIGSISMDPVDHLHLLAGTHSTCGAPYSPLCQIESRDGGTTWSIVNVNIPKAAGWLEQAGPYAIDATTTVYATLFEGLWVSTDKGASWQNATPPEVTGATGGEYTHRPLTRSASGIYYLPGFGNKNGLLKSSDGKAWSYIPNSPSGGYELGLAVGGGNIYLGDFNSNDYQVAAEANPSSWSVFPAPPVANGKQGPMALEYDEAHHILYSSNRAGGLWRMVTP